jgi:pyridoxine 5-phosphate synthase
MPELIVDIEPLAALRRDRDSREPDPARAAMLAELAGAAGIAVRGAAAPFERNDRDIRVLREIVQGRLLLGMAPTTAMMGLALDVKPDEVILLPAHPEEATSEGGLDLILERSEIHDTIATIRESGIPVLVLIDPDPTQVKLAHRLNADGVQISTAGYASPVAAATRQRLLARIVDTAKVAAKLKLRVLAGAGLSYQNAAPLGQVNEIEGCIVGHHLMARSLLTGIGRAVREMRRILETRS